MARGILSMDPFWYQFGYTTMATLTVKNVPEPLVRRLKARATLHRRSLNREVIASLEVLAQAAPVDAEALLARAREVRHTAAGGRLTDRVLARLKPPGRASSLLTRIRSCLFTGAGGTRRRQKGYWSGNPRVWPRCAVP